MTFDYTRGWHICESMTRELRDAAHLDSFSFYLFYFIIYLLVGHNLIVGRNSIGSLISPFSHDWQMFLYLFFSISTFLINSWYFVRSIWTFQVWPKWTFLFQQWIHSESLELPKSLQPFHCCDISYSILIISAYVKVKFTI